MLVNFLVCWHVVARSKDYHRASGNNTGGTVGLPYNVSVIRAFEVPGPRQVGNKKKTRQCFVYV